jgi:RNA polymerase sigma-70 factor (ECF subfamily)
MYRIAHNEAMSFFRARRARPAVELDEGGAALIAEIRDEHADAAALAELRLSRKELGAALAELPERYRDALTLRFFEERSYAEMSDILELPVGTVSTLIHRAKKALRESLSGRLSYD